MVPKTPNIRFLDPEQKVEDGFSLCGDGFFNGLLPGVFATAILLGLGTDRKLQAVAE